MGRIIIKTIVAFLAVCFIFLAVFAIQLGIDNDPGWGRGRYLLLSLGVLMLAWVGWHKLEPQVIVFIVSIQIRFRNLGSPFLSKLASSPWLNRIRASRKKRTHNALFTNIYQNRPVLSLGIVGAIITFLYLWIITAGTIVEWQDGSNYFQMLGDAFSEGQLHLLEEPSPELLASENPYFHKDRGKIPVIWDALFYQGKYYLYWGPVPGLIVVVLQSFTSGEIRDHILAFGFLLGLLVIHIFLLRAIWQRFDWLPRGMFIGGVFALALNAPLIWLLTRPKVYEAAIAGGQFFLMGGLFWAFTGLSRSPISKWRLVLAGMFWAFAANTRVNISLVIAFLVLLVIWQIFILNQLHWWRSVRFSLMFGIPLLIGAAGLMWYNYARFGSPLDFGYHYLITGPTIPEDPSNTFDIAYIIPNTYQYLLRPPELRSEFPYVIVPWIKNDMWPAMINLPPDYFYTEPVASLLLTVPVVGMGILAGLRLGWLHLNGLAPPSISISTDDRLLFRWLTLALTGSLIFALVVLLVFIQNSYRYLVDVTPAATLLAILIISQIRLVIANHPIESWIWGVGWRVVALLTPILGILIAIKGYARAFMNQNPNLYYSLLDWFP